MSFCVDQVEGAKAIQTGPPVDLYEVDERVQWLQQHMLIQPLEEGLITVRVRGTTLEVEGSLMLMKIEIIMYTGRWSLIGMGMRVATHRAIHGG